MPSVSELDLYLLSREIREHLLHETVRRVARTRPQGLWVEMRSGKGLWISLDPAHLMAVVVLDCPALEESPDVYFTRFLEKKRLRRVHVPPGDRLLFLHFGDRGVVVELIGGQRNVYALDEQIRVRHSLFTSRLPMGQPYTSPPHAPGIRAWLLGDAPPPTWLSRKAPYLTRVEKPRTYVARVLQRPEPVVIFPTQGPPFPAPAPLPLEPGERLEHRATLSEAFLEAWRHTLPPVRTVPSVPPDPAQRMQDELQRLEQRIPALEKLARRLMELPIPTSTLTVQEGEETLTLSPGEDPRAVASSLYAEIHRLRRGMETLRQRLQHPGIPQKENAARESPSPSHRPYRLYRAPSGAHILVGTSARSNHQVTFHLARRGDWFLHIKDRPGPHVILRVHGETPSEEDLRYAARLALLHSRITPGDVAEVWMTPRRYVRSVPGDPGKVRFQRVQTLRLTLPPDFHPEELP